VLLPSSLPLLCHFRFQVPTFIYVILTLPFIATTWRILPYPEYLILGITLSQLATPKKIIQLTRGLQLCSYSRSSRNYMEAECSPLVVNLNQTNSVLTTPSYLSKSVLIFSTRLRLGLPNSLFPSGFPTNKLYAFLFSPFHTTCHVLIIFLDLIILIILGESTNHEAPC
jgi:hypothetical protein